MSNRFPYVSDAGDTYRNPVIHADYSDPDVIRHGDDFYMVASSFNCTPGLPILHSRDLINWKLINYGIENVPHPRYEHVQPGCGVWAPSIRFHGGKFWIFFPMPDEGIYMITADDPAGKWSEPHLVQAALGWIDPCPFWDEDGQAYLAHAYANSRSGKRDKIHVRPMAPDGLRLLGEGKIVIDTPHHPYLEGPKFHKVNGWYYILAPGGGVPTGWQVVFRSRIIYGPYEEKIVLERGSTDINGPHQGAMIDLQNGEWWFMHFQDTGPFGRIVHMQPVTWEQGWPLMGVDYDGNGVGEPVPFWKKPSLPATTPLTPLPTSDEFEGPNLGLQWQWFANHRAAWVSLSARPGWLRLHSQLFTEREMEGAPSLLMQKFPGRGFIVETLLDFQPGSAGDSAGLVIVGGGSSASLGLILDGDLFAIAFVVDGEARSLKVVGSGTIRLRVAVDEKAECQFSFASGEEEFTNLEHLFVAKEGGWLGAKVGLFCLRKTSEETAYADFDYFRFSSL